MATMAQAVRMAEARDLLAEAIAQLKASEQRTRAVGAELRPDPSLAATLTATLKKSPESGRPTCRLESRARR
jgi:hypothetical protein